MFLHIPTGMPGAKTKSSRRTRRPCGPSTEFVKSTWNTTEPRGRHITGHVAKLRVYGEEVAVDVLHCVLYRLHPLVILEMSLERQRSCFSLGLRCRLFLAVGGPMVELQGGVGGVEIRGKGAASSYSVPGNIVIASPLPRSQTTLAFLEAGWKPSFQPITF